MKTHHVLKNGEQSGPYTIDEIHAMLSSGEFTAEDLYWVEGMPGWEPLSKVAKSGTASSTPPPPPPTATPGGNTVTGTPATPGFSDTLKKIGGTLLALGKMIVSAIKTAATSEKAKQARVMMVEKSTLICKRASEMASTAANSETVRVAADKINKGAADLRKKASSLAHHEVQPPQSAPLPPVAVGADTVPDTDTSTAGIAPNADSVPPTPEPTAIARPEPIPATTSLTDDRWINWKPALVSFCLIAVFLIGYEVAIYDVGVEKAIIILLIGLPVMILGVIFLSLLQHKCWNSLPAEFRATTPGKAVGFMFIPFFNFYWAFVSWPKLSEGLTNWQKSSGENPTDTKGLGITFAVLFVCHSTIGMIPVLGILIRIAMVVIFILYYRKLVSGINRMMGKSQAVRETRAIGFWTFKRTAIGMAAALPLYWLILAVTYEEPGSYRSSGDRMPSWYTQVQGMDTLPCYVCSGTGTEKEPCRKCYGQGTTTTGSGYEIVCPSCRGTESQTSRCRSCGGSGQVRR